MVSRDIKGKDRTLLAPPASCTMCFISSGAKYRPGTSKLPNKSQAPPFLDIPEWTNLRRESCFSLDTGFVSCPDQRLRMRSMPEMRKLTAKVRQAGEEGARAGRADLTGERSCWFPPSLCHKPRQPLEPTNCLVPHARGEEGKPMLF